MTVLNYEVKRHLDDILEDHMIEEDRRFNELQQEIRDMREDLRALTEAWQQAKGVVSFMKWVAGIGGGVLAWVVFFKDHWK